MNATVVIATYNERENLGGLVSAILEYPSYRVVVVDDDSPDGTGALADSLAASSGNRVFMLLDSQGPKTKVSRSQRLTTVGQGRIFARARGFRVQVR